EKWSLKRTH
ncbi:hypothetical protein TGPRC2_279540B, partial [Toxoplasma gondii TgCatPRC2]